MSQLSLFFDVLLCMTEIDREDYITGKRGGTVIYPEQTSNVNKQLRQRTRQILWDSLHGTHMKAGKGICMLAHHPPLT